MRRMCSYYPRLKKKISQPPEKRKRIMVVSSGTLNQADTEKLVKEVEQWWDTGGVMLVNEVIDQILKVNNDGSVDVIYSKNGPLTERVMTIMG